MLINTNDISTYSAELIERRISNHEVVNVNEWLDGAHSLTLLRTYTRFKEIVLRLVFTSTSDELTFANIDKLIADLKNATIKFDDVARYFDVFFQGMATPEKISPTSHILEITLTGYNTYSAEVLTIASKIASVAISAPSTLPSPALITIVPTVDLASFSITGLTKTALTLTNLVAGRTYTVDGYSYRYLNNGANDIANFSGFEFPVVNPGTNNVGFSATSANVTIKYKPKYN